MRKYLSFLFALMIALSLFVAIPHVTAQTFGLEETAGAADLKKYGNSVPTIAGNIIGTLLSMISVLFFVLVLYGGILWMTARGNAETTAKALNTIIAATIGIIIIMGAYALTNFVFKLGGNAGASTTQPTDSSPVTGECTIKIVEDVDICTYYMTSGTKAQCSTADTAGGFCTMTNCNASTDPECVLDEETDTGFKCENTFNKCDGLNQQNCQAQNTYCEWK